MFHLNICTFINNNSLIILFINSTKNSKQCSWLPSFILCLVRFLQFRSYFIFFFLTLASKEGPRGFFPHWKISSLFCSISRCQYGYGAQLWNIDMVVWLKKSVSQPRNSGFCAAAWATVIVCYCPRPTNALWANWYLETRQRLSCVCVCTRVALCKYLHPVVACVTAGVFCCHFPASNSVGGSVLSKTHKTK